MTRTISVPYNESISEAFADFAKNLSGKHTVKVKVECPETTSGYTNYQALILSYLKVEAIAPSGVWRTNLTGLSAIGTMDLGSIQRIDQVILDFFDSDGRLHKGFKVEVSTDKKTWTEVSASADRTREVSGEVAVNFTSQCSLHPYFRGGGKKLEGVRPVADGLTLTRR